MIRPVFIQIRTSLVLGILALLVVMSLLQPEKVSMPDRPQNRNWMEGTGFGVGDRTIRMQTIVRDPVYLSCTNFDLSGSFSVSLNAAGEAYFGSYKDDVNTAIAAAVSDAVTNLLATAGKRCEDDCYAVLSNEQAGSSGDASATAMVVLTSGGETTELCWPDPGNVPDIGIRVTASAPGVAGFDMSPLLEAINTASYPSRVPPNPDPGPTPSDVATSLAGTVDTLLGTDRLAYYVPSVGFFLFTPPDTLSYYLGINFATKQVTLQYTKETDVGSSYPTSSVITAYYDSAYLVEDTLETTTLTLSSKNSEYSSSSSEMWGASPANSSFFPDSFTIAYSDGTTPRTIDQTIPLTNTGGETDVHTPSGDTASLTASGSMTIALSAAAPKLIDPGYRPVCRYNSYWKNRFPFVEDCTVLQRFDYVTMPDSLYPPGRPPECTIWFRWKG